MRKMNGALNVIKLYVKSVMEALNLVKTGKAAGPSDVTSELLKVCQDESVKKLPEMADDLLKGIEMHESWRKSDSILIYKGERDVRSGENYKNVKFIEHGMNVIERVFEKQLRNVVKLDETQMGFFAGRETVHAFFILLQMLENYDIAGRK